MSACCKRSSCDAHGENAVEIRRCCRASQGESLPSQSRAIRAEETTKTHSVDASQRIQAVSVDLTDPASCNQAFDKAEEVQGRPVDLLISCVGGAGPCLGLFEDLSPDQLRIGMDTNYFATLWPVRVRFALDTANDS